jgi:hypothetical protein
MTKSTWGGLGLLPNALLRTRSHRYPLNRYAEKCPKSLVNAEHLIRVPEIARERMEFLHVVKNVVREHFLSILINNSEEREPQQYVEQGRDCGRRNLKLSEFFAKLHEGESRVGSDEPVQDVGRGWKHIAYFKTNFVP